MPKAQVREQSASRWSVSEYGTHDIVVEIPVFHPAENPVRYHTFDVSAFPYPPRMPMVMRRETLVRGRDMGLFCNHDFYTLRVIRGGHGLHVCGNHPYAMVRGDAYLVPPGAIYSFHDFRDIEMDVCYFQRRLFRRAEWAALRESSGFAKLIVPMKLAGHGNRKDFRDRRLHLTPEQHAEVDRDIEAIRGDICQPQAMGAILARNRLFGLLGNLARLHEAHEEGEGRSAPPTLAGGEAMRLAELIEFCERHFHLPIGVRDLAARMCLSPVHFARIFTAETGVPPATYLRRLRLEHAQALLRTTSLSVSEIATACGFAHPDVLSRAFGQAFKATPSKYRKSFRWRTES